MRRSDSGDAARPDPTEQRSYPVVCKCPAPVCTCPASSAPRPTTFKTRAVEEIIEGLQIQTIRAKLELCRIMCACLAAELENPSLTQHERTAIAMQWDHLLREGDILAFFLDLLRRRDKELRDGTGKNKAPVPEEQQRSSDQFA